MIQKQTFTIEGADNRAIFMDLTSKEDNGALVIFVHGFKGFKDWGTHDLVADFFAGNGINFLKFNFSHNGTTPESPLDFTDLEAFGNNTFSKELFDLDQVITFAEKRKESGSTGNIYLIGHSLGGGISIVQAAEDKRIRKLTTWASVSRFRNLWMTEVEPLWRKEGVIYVDNARTGQKKSPES
jgi:dienelactone hydrolase